MQQIDTTGGAAAEDANGAGVSEASIMKEHFKSQVTEYMSRAEFRKQIRSLLKHPSQQRLSVSIDDLRGFDPNMANYVMRNPIDAVSMFEGELDRTIKEMQDDSAKGASEKQAAATNDKAFPTKTKRYYINFEGAFGKNLVTPRGLKADKVNQLVQVQGIVTRMGLVKPMI